MHLKAYPNYDYFISGRKESADLNKWISIMKNIYLNINNGMDFNSAFEKNTENWDEMEKLNFSRWLKFYTSNSHKKYAQVNYWDDINRAGYFVSPKADDIKATNDQIDSALNQEEDDSPSKTELIESQKSKILSRLDSAEKLLRQPICHDLAGTELSNIMRAIYDLKEKIHLLKKKSFSNSTYHDLIVRQANIFNKQGCIKEYEFLNKIAQDLPLPPLPPLPTQNTGLPGTLPGEAPSLTPQSNNPIAPDKIKGEESDGMKGFLEGLDSGIFSPEENDLYDENNLIVVEAQVNPPPVNLTVEEKKPSNIDEKMHQMLQSVTLEEVIQKLEDNTKVYKTRQMSRELALIDMMLDQLGLAPYFPSLAEATNKSLDANQYILTRLEDITSRLRGAISTNPIDLKPQAKENPNTVNVKQNLETEDLKEKQRKENRKKLEDQKLNKQNEPLEVEEDLNKPVQVVPQATQSPVAPTPVK